MRDAWTCPLGGLRQLHGECSLWRLGSVTVTTRTGALMVRKASYSVGIHAQPLTMASVAPRRRHFVGGCGQSGSRGVDPRPEKLDGTESREFEQEDLDAAAAASDAVKAYCAATVSEAQRLGCESHVSEDDLP